MKAKTYYQIHDTDLETVNAHIKEVSSIVRTPGTPRIIIDILGRDILALYDALAHFIMTDHPDIEKSLFETYEYENAKISTLKLYLELYTAWTDMP